MRASALKKTLLTACLMFTCMASFAAAPGFYVGAGGGMSQLALPQHKGISDGFGGRVFAGYHLNPYLGFEAGVAHYAPAKYNYAFNNPTTSLFYTMNAIDLVAKTYLPFGEDKFSIYALGGFAAVDQSVKMTSHILSVQTIKNHKIRPIYGVGIGYDVPKSHVTANIEMTRIHGIGTMQNNPNAIPAANMLSISLTYNFN